MTLFKQLENSLTRNKKCLKFQLIKLLVSESLKNTQVKLKSIPKVNLNLA